MLQTGCRCLVHRAGRLCSPDEEWSLMHLLKATIGYA